MTTITAKGQDLIEFLEFFEAEKAIGNYAGVDHKEEIDKNNRVLDASLLSILLSGSIALMSSLILDYFKKRSNHEVTFEGVNSKGQKIVLSLKNMSKDDVMKLLEEFRNS
ncbi:MAG: hypothetical protein HYZ42_16585 [Bacteroidetes bacterium]|nr:hypothetical protein [Bacteroidota bacterium]